MENLDNDIAIIGMSGVFPQAENVQEFYRNLCAKTDSVSTPPKDRVKYAGFDPKKDYKLAGQLGRIDLFDHQFFNMSKKEAEYLEPSQRIALQLACTAIENAGYSLDQLRNTNTGIFMASSSMFAHQYLQRISSPEVSDPTIHTGTLSSMVFGRIAYELQLTGPGIMVDTGCSSALIAANEAVEKLILGKIDYALVGAVNLKWWFYTKSDNGGHLRTASTSGKSRAFDAEADGIGVGEGGGMLLLKRASQARADKNRIHAIIKGIGLSQDGGRSNSITAPSPQAQTEAILKAWKAAGVDAESITYIEAHGAGTKLGDVIEFQSLTDAFNKHTNRRSFCAVSAAKSNIGHIGNAAGIAGIIKGVLSLKNKLYLPSLHFDTPNPFIDFENSAAFVNTECIPWPETEGRPRRCGISSFGLSGTNAHLVLEEAPEEEKVSVNEQIHILKISAKSPAALYNFVKDITEHISSASEELQDILYTLNKGRNDYNYRLAFSAKDRDHLLDQLKKTSWSQVRTLTPSRQKARKAVVLFSTEKFSGDTLQTLCHHYPVIREAVAQVTGDAPADTLGSWQQAFAIQYGLYRQLLAFGIQVEAFMGAGCGNMVTKVIMGAISPAEAMAQLATYAPAPAPFKRDAFKDRIKGLQAKHDPIYIEMGDGGILSTSLTSFSAEIPGLQLTHLTGGEAGSLEAAFVELYRNGANVDWQLHYKGRERVAVDAPTYPFDKIRCWFSKPYPEMIENVAEWCFEPSWTPADVVSDGETAAHRTFLVFCDTEGLYKEIVYRFSPDTLFILVHPGESFQAITDNSFRIDSSNPQDYQTLRRHLSQLDIHPDGIIYLHGYAAPYTLTSSNYSSRIAHTFLPVYHIVRAFDTLLQKPGFDLACVTSNAYRVSGQEPVLLPVNVMVAGLFKGLLTEYLGLNISHVDISFHEHTAAETADFLWKEMHNSGPIRFSAVRTGKRHVMLLAKATFDAEVLQKEFTVKDDGVYLITGGATGIGLETARMLADQGRCTLLIIGRSAEPSEDLHELEAAGARVDYYSADVGDYDGMQTVLSAIRTKYGKVNGLIHAAGIGSSGVRVKDRELQDIHNTLRAKVGGTVILEEWVEPLGIEFVLFFASVSSVVPSKNCADYTAASAFEDAVAHHGRLNNRKYMAIDWSDWKETGVGYRKNLLRSKEIIAEREKMVQGIYNEEGKAVIRCVLSLGIPQLAVAKADMSFFRVNPFFVLGPAAQPGSVPIPAQVDATNEPKPVVPINSTPDTDIPNTETPAQLTTEEKVMQIWYKVLKLDNIGLDDDFYEIGGHSLNIMQLLNLLNKEFGVEIGVEEMVYNSTVRQLAERIGTLEAGVYEPIEPLPPAEHYAVSHAQKRFWLLNQLEGREAYNVPMAFRLTGPMHLDILQKALQALVTRHESLRTSFRWTDGALRQYIHDPATVGPMVRYLDLSDEPDEKKADATILGEAGIPFSLDQPPLIRGLVLKTASDCHIICITLHHIVADVRSTALIKTELLHYYQQFTNNNAPDLKPLSIQYKDFAAWQNRQLAGDRYLGYRKYWLQRLEGYNSSVSIAADFPRPEVLTAAADRIVFAIGPDKTRQLRRMAERNGTTTFVVALTLFNVLLSRLTKTSDITIATPVSGRSHADLEDQVGVFLNTLLLRTKIDAEDTFKDLLQQVKFNTVKDFERQIYPFDLIIQESSTMQKDQPPFNVGFTWNTKENIDDEADTGMTIEEHATGFVMAKADLWMLTSERPEDITCSFVFRTCLYKRETIDIFRDRFLALMNEALKGYDKKIKELDIRLAAECALEETKLDIDFGF